MTILRILKVNGLNPYLKSFKSNSIFHLPKKQYSTRNPIMLFNWSKIFQSAKSMGSKFSNMQYSLFQIFLWFTVASLGIELQQNVNEINELKLNWDAKRKVLLNEIDGYQLANGPAPDDISNPLGLY
ncbi:hypothetical protein HDV02_004487 [Globomyces sp. JEL0801]|nr:hypothetical protein HDV02_004487 [Globomyces sp. JEL0801]